MFTIDYRDRSPKRARDVVQTLLTIFIESATGGSRTDMENARHFLERQIQSYEQQLRAAEKRRADFRARYIEILPADNNPETCPRWKALAVKFSRWKSKLQDALIYRDALKREVEKMPPMLVVESGRPSAVLNGRQVVKSGLQDAREQLDVLLLKDTDQHPDVIAQRRLIESLKEQPVLVRPAKAGRNASGELDQDADTLRRSVPNQVYDQLKVKLIDADTLVISLRRQHDDALRYRERLEKTQREQPGLIAEYQNMDRDYSVLQRNYDALLSRLQSANIAQAADTQADKVKLQIIDPPEIPRLPVAPNRMLLITGVLVGGLGTGAGMMVLFGQLDRSFSSVNDLRTLGLPVLGGISVLGLAPLRQQSDGGVSLRRRPHGPGMHICGLSSSTSCVPRRSFDTRWYHGLPSRCGMQIRFSSSASSGPLATSDAQNQREVVTRHKRTQPANHPHRGPHGPC